MSHSAQRNVPASKAVVAKCRKDVIGLIESGAALDAQTIVAEIKPAYRYTDTADLIRIATDVIDEYKEARAALKRIKTEAKAAKLDWPWLVTREELDQLSMDLSEGKISIASYAKRLSPNISIEDATKVAFNVMGGEFEIPGVESKSSDQSTHTVENLLPSFARLGDGSVVVYRGNTSLVEAASYGAQIPFVDYIEDLLRRRPEDAAKMIAAIMSQSDNPRDQERIYTLNGGYEIKCGVNYQQRVFYADRSLFNVNDKTEIKIMVLLNCFEKKTNEANKKSRAAIEKSGKILKAWEESANLRSGWSTVRPKRNGNEKTVFGVLLRDPVLRLEVTKCMLVSKLQDAMREAIDSRGFTYEDVAFQLEMDPDTLRSILMDYSASLEDVLTLLSDMGLELDIHEAVG